MKSKPNSLTMARSAILNHAAAFVPRWGETNQTEDGTVLFAALPSKLESLKVVPEFRKRWMGGTCAMNIKFSHQSNSLGKGILEFKGSRGGHFRGKTDGLFSVNLLAKLNSDNKLKETLLSIDLEALTIKVEDNCVKTVMTPYGGGLVYLIIPPMRSVIPLPAEQIKDIAWSLEKIASLIDSSFKNQ